MRVLTERKKQAQAGGLIEFVRYFWHILEPAAALTEGWPLEAICAHLEAVTFGNIQKLLMNVPPGFTKSMMTDVFWPAWEWGPMNMPTMRYVAFSYSAGLTERDNDRFALLVTSPEYQELWAERFQIRKTGVGKIVNDKTGWKLASSVGGVGTGERGDRILCFPAETLVQTENGRIPIGDIVRQRMPIKAWSYSAERGLELKPIVGWHVNPSRALVRIALEDGSFLVCTVDHRILTPGGYRPAEALRVGDMLLTAPSRVHVTAPDVAVTQRQVEVLPCAPISDATDCLMTDAVFSRKNHRSVVVSLGYLAHHFLGKMRRAVAEITVALAVRNVLRSRSVFKIIQPWVGSVAVFVSDLLTGRAWTNERSRYHLVNEPVYATASEPHGDARVAFAEDGRQQSASHDHFVRRSKFNEAHVFEGVVPFVAVDVVDDSAGRPGAGNATRQATHAALVANLVSVVVAGNDAPRFMRIANIGMVDRHVDETFCLTVADNHNMLCGDGASSIVCANCDDPHNVKEVESDTIREEAVRWFRESMSNRFNNEDSAIVVIMQRLHEADISGTILSEGFDYCHLMIPMEYDPDRYPLDYQGTDIGWLDPREELGDLAWPERFPPEKVETLKHELGPFAFAGQYQQSPVPRGGGIFKRIWWQVWEPQDGKWPVFSYLVASLDGAYTKDKENDPSALTVWGIFTNQAGLPCVMLVKAWRKFLELHGAEVERQPNERFQAWRKRAEPEWGLVEWVAETCRFRNSDGVVIGTVDRLIIEAKANGISVAQEIQRLYGDEGWLTELNDPHGDKVSRAHSVVPVFANSQVWAPNREWADVVLDEMEVFPHGRYDDLTDTATQAIRHLRTGGMLQQKTEIAAEDERRSRLKSRKMPLYQV